MHILDPRVMDGLLIHRYFYPVKVLGPGRRVGIWFQGCVVRCEGCIAKEIWEFNPEKFVKYDDLAIILKSYYSNSPDGITISGGEPFDQPEGLLKLLMLVREIGYQDILVYSGYRFEKIKNEFPDICELINILISEPFEQDLPNTRVWCGSDNQWIHLLKQNGEYDEQVLNDQRYTEKREIQLEWCDGDLVIFGIPRRDLKSAFSDISDLG